MPRLTRSTVLVGCTFALLVVGCSENDRTIGTDATPGGCAVGFAGYRGLVDHLEAGFSDQPWANRVSVCQGGVLQLDQSDVSDDDREAEALAVCEAAAGYLAA